MGIRERPCVCAGPLTYVWLFAALCTVDLQAPLSMGFSRQEYWSGLPCPSPGDLPDSGIKLASLTSALAGSFFTTRVIWEAQEKGHSNAIVWKILRLKKMLWGELTCIISEACVCWILGKMVETRIHMWKQDTCRGRVQGRELRLGFER